MTITQRPDRPRHRTRATLAAILLLTALGTAGGCQPARPPYRSGGSYETLAHDPRRDTAAAQRDNAEAIVQIHDEHWTEAEATLKVALTADVTFGPAHSNLGTVYEYGGNHYLAAWEYQYAATLMPDAPEPRNNLGLVFESVDKLDEAIEWYDRAVALRPDSAVYAGNDVRARLKRGDRDERVRTLLQTVVMRDDRPAWVQWARARLVTMPPASTTMP